MAVTYAVCDKCNRKLPVQRVHVGTTTLVLCAECRQQRLPREVRK
jgi:RNA polymerase-binding transcription factor DksA